MCISLYYILCKKQKVKLVSIYSLFIYKTVGKQYPDDLLHLLRFCPEYLKSLRLKNVKVDENI